MNARLLTTRCRGFSENKWKRWKTIVDLGKRQNQHVCHSLVMDSDKCKCSTGDKSIAEGIREFHAHLRANVKNANGNTEKVWEDHKANTKNLQNYSNAMVKLSELWQKSQPLSESRIEWCRNVCKEYFWNGGMMKALAKEQKKASYTKLQTGKSIVTNERESFVPIDFDKATVTCQKMIQRKLILLDVGSCFNPFQQFKEEFDVLAIDLWPAPSTAVCRCDFLEIDITEEKEGQHLTDGARIIQQNNCLPRPDTEWFCMSKGTETQGTDSVDSLNVTLGETGHIKGLIKEYQNEETGAMQQGIITSSHRCMSQKEHHSRESTSCKHYNTPWKQSGEVLQRNFCHSLHSHTTDNVNTDEFQISRYEYQISILKGFIPSKPIRSLPGQFFDVIVFSLFLSYLPSPQQRWKCCVKASKLLSIQGLLLVIESDSAHQNRNSRQIRSWKEALSSLGFVRLKYEKLSHLHCMAFRKSLQVAEIQDQSELMFIPQDFHDEHLISNKKDHEMRNEEEDKEVSEFFKMLPESF